MSRITVEEVRFGDLTLTASFGADQGIALGPSLLLPVDGLADLIAQALGGILNTNDVPLLVKAITGTVVAALEGADDE
jgi:hypothetical protein